jgi:hypothetical protein
VARRALRAQSPKRHLKEQKCVKIQDRKFAQCVTSLFVPSWHQASLPRTLQLATRVLTLLSAVGERNLVRNKHVSD